MPIASEGLITAFLCFSTCSSGTLACTLHSHFLGWKPPHSMENLFNDPIHLWTCRLCHFTAGYVCQSSGPWVKFLGSEDQENTSPKLFATAKAWENGQGEDYKSATYYIWFPHMLNSQVGADIRESHKTATLQAKEQLNRPKQQSALVKLCAGCCIMSWTSYFMWIVNKSEIWRGVSNLFIF